MTSRLPTPGGDTNTWGNILNDFLNQSHNSDGSLQSSAVNTAATAATPADNSVTTAKIADGSVTNAKLDSATQTTLAQAASAYVKPAGGIPETDMASAVQAALTSAGTAAQQSANLSDLANKTTARQNLNAAPAGLPSYAPVALTHDYDPILNVYGMTAANMAQVRAALGKARSGIGLAHLLAIGDSHTEGYMGSGVATPNDPLNSYPMVVKNALLAMGIPSAGTGWVQFSNFTVTPDPRWTTTGTWSRAAATYGYASSAGSTATLTLSGGGATNVDILTTNQSAAWTYQVFNSGGTSIASGTLSVSGAASMKVVQLSGLTDAASLTVTSVAGTNILSAANIYKTTGLLVSNFAYYGSLASGTGGWASDSTYYNPGSVAVAAVPSPDFVFGTLGTNDIAQGASVATVYSALTAVYNRWPNASRMMCAPWQAAGFTTATWNGYCGGLYSLADTLGIAVYDMYDRSQGYAAYNSRGLMQDGATATHPNKAAHADVGQSIAALLSTETAASSTSTTTTSSQPNAPTYAPSNLSNSWQPDRSAYNLTGASMHTIHAKLAKVAQNTSGIHILHMSDSTGIGFPGSNPIVEKNSIPFRMAKALSRLTGNPYITTGLTFAGASASIPADAWTLTGSWSVASGTIYNSGAATATFTTPQPCTNLEIYYSNITPSFSYTVDGGAPVSVTTTGQAVTTKLALSGLTYGTHTVVLTLASLSLLMGFRCWTAGLNQIHIHNLSFGGAKANNTGLDASVDWSNTTSTNPVGLGLTATALMSVSGLAFDIAGICIGSNDLASGLKDAAALKTGIENMIGYTGSAAIYLVHEIPIGGTNATLAATAGANFFDLADEHDCPLFDWDDYVNGLNSYIADGQAGADGLHPIFSHQNMIGTWIADTLAQRSYFGDLNFPGIAGLPGGRYRLTMVSGAYPPRPPVPAGCVDYVGTTQPTDWLAGDTWDQTT